MNYGKLNALMKLGREFGHRKIRNAGVSDTGHTICTFLYFHDGVSQDTVAGALMMDKTTVAKALLSLETKGFIVREPNPENRRKNILRITGAGKETIGDSLHIYDQWQQRINACFTDQEQREFDRLLDKLLDCALRIREEDRQPSSQQMGEQPNELV